MIADLLQLATFGHNMELLSGLHQHQHHMQQQQQQLQQQSAQPATQMHHHHNNQTSANPNNNRTNHRSQRKTTSHTRQQRLDTVTAGRQTDASNLTQVNSTSSLLDQIAAAATSAQVSPRAHHLNDHLALNLNLSHHRHHESAPLDLTVKRVRTTSGHNHKSAGSNRLAGAIKKRHTNNKQQQVALNLVANASSAIKSLELIDASARLISSQFPAARQQTNFITCNTLSSSSSSGSSSASTSPNSNANGCGLSSAASSISSSSSSGSSYLSAASPHHLNSSATAATVEIMNDQKQRRRASLPHRNHPHQQPQVTTTTSTNSTAHKAPSSELMISTSSGRRQKQKGTKSHLCNHCGRSFSRSDMLTRHSRLHSGLKPYQCGKCLQVFSRSDHLSTHERTHTGEKPYQCEICAYSACRRDMITRHMRTHLGGGVVATGQQQQTPKASPSSSSLSGRSQIAPEQTNSTSRRIKREQEAVDLSEFN